MKKMFFMVIFVLSMGITNAQIFILGDATVPSIGGMVHFQTMDVPQMGFYNYGIYGNSKTKDLQTISLAAGLSYYFAEKNQRPNPQDCLRLYAGFNYNVFWRGDDIIYPAGSHQISFDLGASRTFGDFTMMIMLDPLNWSVKPGISYYF
jgi:hypothetical protein